MNGRNPHKTPRLESFLPRLASNSLTTFDFNFLVKHYLQDSIPEKDSQELFALWVTFFRTMRNHPNIDQLFKYKTMEAFSLAYQHHFDQVDGKESEKLYYIANWMAILFTMVESRGNKGLAMNVIPRLVEGFHVRYNTGGGQSLATSHRVHIYEVEGNVKPIQRPKRTRSDEICLKGLFDPLHRNNSSLGPDVGIVFAYDGDNEAAVNMITAKYSASLHSTHKQIIERVRVVPFDTDLIASGTFSVCSMTSMC